MRRALPSRKVVFCLTTLFCLGGSLPFRHALANPGHLAARSGGLISDRRDVIPDPLSGIPEEDDKGRGGRGRGGQGGAQGQHRAQTADPKGSCRLEIKPESDRAIGDLRAVVAFMQRGPRTVACPATATPAPIRLRLTIDGSGTITAVERLSGDEKLGENLVRKLAGQVSESKITSATTGVVQIQSRRGAK
jgi:hypothetical protein